MIALSSEAEAQLDAPIAHYEALGRIEASINLLNALERAQERIEKAPDAGLLAPRPYPSLAKADRRWVIEGIPTGFPQPNGPACYLRGVLCHVRYPEPSLSCDRNSYAAVSIAEPHHRCRQMRLPFAPIWGS